MLVTATGRLEVVPAEASWTAPSLPGAPAPLFVALEEQLGAVLNARGVPENKPGLEQRGWALRGDEADRALVALAPRRSVLLQARPTFRWQAPPGVQDLRIMVARAGGQQEQVWKQPGRVADGVTSLTYPENEPALAAGDYVWEVQGTVNGRQEIGGAPFTVAASLTTAQSAELRAARKLASERGTSLPLIAVLIRQRLYADAETALIEARKAAPDDRTLSLLLARLYLLRRLTIPEQLIHDR